MSRLNADEFLSHRVLVEKHRRIPVVRQTTAPYAVLDLRAGLNVFRFHSEAAWRLAAAQKKRVALRWHEALGEYVAEDLR